MDITAMTSPSLSPATATATPTITSVTTPEVFWPLFVYGARALSLDAELFERDERGLLPDGQGQGYRVRLGCPNGNSSSTTRTPEERDADDQCARANLFPAEMYASDGPEVYEDIFGGTFTPTAAPAKTWRCTVSGEYPTTTPFPYLRQLNGNCSQWVSSAGAGAAVVITTEGLDWCAVLRQKSPARLTAGRAAGFKEMEGASYYWDPSNYNSHLATDMSSWGCPDPTSLVNFAAAATTTTDASGTGTAESAAGSTTASRGAASRGNRAGSVALACMVLASAHGAGLLSLSLW